jgi:hypothetical protein
VTLVCCCFGKYERLVMNVGFCYIESHGRAMCLCVYTSLCVCLSVCVYEPCLV